MESLTDYYKFAYIGGMGGQSFHSPGIKNRKSSESPEHKRKKSIGKLGPSYGIDESRIPMIPVPKATT